MPFYLPVALYRLSLLYRIIQWYFAIFGVSCCSSSRLSPVSPRADSLFGVVRAVEACLDPTIRVRVREFYFGIIAYHFKLNKICAIVIINTIITKNIFTRGNFTNLARWGKIPCKLQAVSALMRGLCCTRYFGLWPCILFT